MKELIKLVKASKANITIKPVAGGQIAVTVVPFDKPIRTFLIAKLETEKETITRIKAVLKGK